MKSAIGGSAGLPPPPPHPNIAAGRLSRTTGSGADAPFADAPDRMSGGLTLTLAISLRL
jgi:hypothetical protein